MRRGFRRWRSGKRPHGGRRPHPPESRCWPSCRDRWSPLSPTLRPRAETSVREYATETQCGQRVSRWRAAIGEWWKSLQKGGVEFRNSECAPDGNPSRAIFRGVGSVPRLVQDSWTSAAASRRHGACRTDDRRDRLGRQTRPPRACGLPDGDAPGRCSTVLCVPVAALPSAARDPGRGATRKPSRTLTGSGVWTPTQSARSRTA